MATPFSFQVGPWPEPRVLRAATRLGIRGLVSPVPERTCWLAHTVISDASLYGDLGHSLPSRRPVKQDSRGKGRGRNRTANLEVTNIALCQLSYSSAEVDGLLIRPLLEQLKDAQITRWQLSGLFVLLLWFMGERCSPDAPQDRGARSGTEDRTRISAITRMNLFQLDHPGHEVCLAGDR